MVEFDAHNQWLDVMRNKFIPFVRESNFDNIVFTRVLANDAEDGFTYSLQVPLSDMEHYKQFSAKVMDEYIAISAAFFGERVLYFTTLLKKVDIE